MAFKRKRVYAPKRNVRRKGAFKKKRRNGSRTNTITNHSGSGRSLANFKSKMMKKRQYNSLLWKSTLFLPHYRACQAMTQTVTIAAGAGTMKVNVVDALAPNGSAFWLAAGGALDPDGSAIPGFALDNFVIRGGSIQCCLANIDNADTIKIVVSLVRTGELFDSSQTPSTIPVGWDPSIGPDFKTKVGKIIMKKEFLLGPNDVFDLTYRVPIQRILAEDFLVVRNSYVWFLTAVVPNGGTANYQVTNSVNLSFTGDAIS